ncbi:DinB family protein [Sphingobacterium suaedae]|uniref:DinB family protein n=1 Tax=Sphingobacterium suaedae TaxID=1686402 RepID=A0ABW5KJY8_9SPHI
MHLSKNETVEEVNRVFTRARECLLTYPEEKINGCPPTGGWTIGQVAEHIIICSDGIPDRQTTEADRPFYQFEDQLKHMFLDVTQKYEAAPTLYPTKGKYELEQLEDALERNRLRLIQKAESTDLKALCVDMEFPTFGLLTRYEWIRFICFHTERHLWQIRKIGHALAST